MNSFSTFMQLANNFLLHTDYYTLNKMYDVGIQLMVFIICTVYMLSIINIIYSENLIEKYSVKKIIKNNNLYCVYQPIIDLRTGLIYGYESLTRTYSWKYKNTKSFIADIYKFKLIEEFTLLTIENAINGFKGLENNKYLFVNTDTKLLITKFDKLYNALKNLDIELRKSIILELTEYNSVDDMSKLQQSLQKIRDLGIRIAIDDYGVGYSNIDLRMAISAEFIKVDMQFTKDIDKVDKKKELIKRMVEFNKYTETITICEGIETKEELDTLIEIGVDYGQGYYLGKPDKIEKFM
jgi:EAL domain-containing protein (putative c-di-GMP-specific phosphodiesterase class I)